MKKTLTFAATEAVAAVSFYNNFVRAVGDPSLKEISVKSMVAAAVKPSTDGGPSISVAFNGDITITWEVDSKVIVKVLTILEKYISPIVMIGRGVYGLLSGLKPLLKNLDKDLTREIKYDGAVAVAFVSDTKYASAEERTIKIDWWSVEDTTQDLSETAISAVKALPVDPEDGYNHHIVLIFADGSTQVRDARKSKAKKD